MAGFDNDVMYADNVDFTGGSPVTGKVTTNGQLLIGSTASPNIRVGSLTSLDGSVTITTGAGTIDLAASVASSTTYTADSGSATPAADNLNVLGGTGLSTSGAGDTLTINADATVPLSFPTDSGTATPAANALTISGQLAGTVPVVFTIGSGSTVDVEDRTWISSLVVDPSATVGLRGTYQTITAALAAASSGQTIYIRPGTYTENITLVAGVNLVGMQASGLNASTVISGTITVTYSGSCSLTGLALQNNGNNDIISMSGVGAANLYISNCRFTNTAGAGSHYVISCSQSGGAYVKVFNCFGNLNGANAAYWNFSQGNLVVQDCYFLNDQPSSVPNAISGSVTAEIKDSTISNPCSATGSTILILQQCQLGRETDTVTVLALTSGAICRASFTSFLCGGGGTAVPVTIDATSKLEAQQCSVVVNNPSGGTLISVTAGGGLGYDVIGQRDPSLGTGQASIQAPTNAAISYFGSATFTQGQRVAVTTPGGYPYTTLTTDYMILVDTSAARTITPLASPKTGQDRKSVV